MISFANFAEVLCELCGQKLSTAALNREGRQESPQRTLRKSSLAATPWVCPKAAAVGNSIHYRASEKRKGFNDSDAPIPASSGLSAASDRQIVVLFIP
jgi:hypothetical protein